MLYGSAIGVTLALTNRIYEKHSGIKIKTTRLRRKVKKGNEAWEVSVTNVEISKTKGHNQEVVSIYTFKTVTRGDQADHHRQHKCMGETQIYYFLQTFNC